MITTNIPKEIYINNDNVQFHKGERVRILAKNYNYSCIGDVIEINTDSIILLLIPLSKWDTKRETKRIVLKDIEKIRKAEQDETLDNVPYFDDEEKEFWRTHWCTKDGIKEKTEEDIKMLKDFFSK